MKIIFVIVKEKEKYITITRSNEIWHKLVQLAKPSYNG